MLIFLGYFYKNSYINQNKGFKKRAWFLLSIFLHIAKS